MKGGPIAGPLFSYLSFSVICYMKIIAEATHAE